MKIGVLSDIHEGINRKKTGEDILPTIHNWIDTNNPDVFIIAGDMTAKPQQALTLLNQLQKTCSKTKILFVHGNHDVYDENSVNAYETLLQFPGNLGNGVVELNKDWVVIGDGGWYDYSYGLPQFKTNDFKKGTFRDFTWPDKTYAHWSEPDQDVTDRYIRKLSYWLEKHREQNIIMVTHFVPFSHFVEVKNDPGWDFFNAMQGSSVFGELAKQYNIKKYIFGHVHKRYHEQYNGMEIICNPLGYYPHEWATDSAEEEITSTIKMITI
ncbi:metallophosphoesterase [Virgibacillus ihumii]|uniref:metallophosphoesterase n=1 Tax=Virgibacillus ihumii TaxID=2686091 RepID=UPI00157BC5BC|nr:metallophosphoesterase [Virgibacillus ihumii]